MRMNMPPQSMSGVGRRLVRRTFLQACTVLGATLSIRSTGSRAADTTQQGRLKWLAFYGETSDEQELAVYDLVVLDPKFQGSLPQVGTNGARLCGYLSLGEVRVADGLYANADPAVLIEENPAWPGTFRIDVRHPSWSKLVLDEIIPFIVGQGFTGLFLDTLDTPPYLEQLQPDAKRGMRQAAIGLVQSIRDRYTDLFVIINRGYALLPDVVASVDAVVAESLLTVADDRDSSGYRWNSPSEVDQVLSLLAPAAEGDARVPILSLDYWDPEDTATITKIYARQRELGHHPYVATRSLDRIVPEPGQ